MNRTPHTMTVFAVFAILLVATGILGMKIVNADDVKYSDISDSANLIQNSGFENGTSGNPANWSEDAWGSLDAKFTYPAPGDSGKAAEVTISNYKSGDAKWVFDPVSVDAGKSYFYENNYKSNVATEIDLVYIDGSGNQTYDYLATLPASGSWKSVRETFTVPKGTVKLSVLHILYSNGSLTIDNAALYRKKDDGGTPPPDNGGGDDTTPPPSDGGGDDGDTPPPPSDGGGENGGSTACQGSSDNAGGLVKNGSFENCKNGNPVGWSEDSWGSLSANFEYPADGKLGNGAKVTISNYKSGDAKWVSDAVAVEAGATYSFTDAYQATAVTEVDVMYIDGSGNVTYDFLVSLSPSSSWKDAARSFVVPAGVKKVSLLHILYSNGTLSTDNISLTKTSDGGGDNDGGTPPDNGGGDDTPPPPSDGGGDDGGTTPPPSDGGGENGGSTACQGSSDNAGGLVKNGSFENCKNGNPVGWSEDSWGSLSANFEYPADGKSGNGAKVTISNYKSGDAKWVSDAVAVEGNAVYQYSDAYTSTASTEIDVIYYDSSGNATYDYLTTTPATNSWKNVSTTFTVPSGTKKAVVVHILHGNGSLSIDNVRLNKVQEGNEGGSGMVTIDFDDGWKSQYENALPILEKEGIQSTFFIITNPIKSGWSGYMTPSEVKDLSRRGYEIEGHTVNHPHLPKLSESEIRAEVVNSKNYLEGLLGTQIEYLAYPYGEYNNSVVDIVKDAGYKAARSTRNGTNNADTDHYALRATSVTENTTLSQIQSWVDEAKRTDTWMIITFHRIGDPGHPYNASPELLQNTIDYVQSQNIPIVSEGVGLSRI